MLYEASSTVLEYCKEPGIDLKDKSIHTAYGADWDAQENYKIYIKLMKACARKEQKALDKIFLLISKNLRNWWD